MKTAMQQMIDIFKRQINHLENTQEKQGLSEYAKGALFSLHSRLIDAEELLEAEKQQIIKAYDSGFLDGYQSGKYSKDGDYDYDNSDDYYSKNFNGVDN